MIMEGFGSRCHQHWMSQHSLTVFIGKFNSSCCFRKAQTCSMGLRSGPSRSQCIAQMLIKIKIQVCAATSMPVTLSLFPAFLDIAFCTASCQVTALVQVFIQFWQVGRRHVIYVFACNSECLSTGSKPTEVPCENCLNSTVIYALHEKTNKTMAFLNKGHNSSET